MKLDILAFGAHPDDVELCCSGTVIKHVHAGYKVGVVDLTRGELGTRGTAELRDQEAADAAKIMGISIRENLQFADGFFLNDKEHQLEVIKIIRKYQPNILLANALTDRHPDHGRAAQLVKEAAFLAGLAKVKTSLNNQVQTPWRPSAVYHYVQAYYHNPGFVVDISKHFDQKVQSLMAFKSQFFNPESSEPETFISKSNFMDFVRGRSIEFGKIIGVEYGEAFVSERYVGVKDLTQLI